MTNPAQKPHVLILGAGLGGLTLAQVLKKAGISYEIFDRDEHIASRAGGWAIALHTILSDLKAQMPSGIPPMETLSHLHELDLPCHLCFYAGGKKMFVESTPDQPIIRANRQKLREWLANGVDVQWDKHVSAIHQSSDSVELVFKDGSEAVGDVLVGADGANSFVRRHLLGDEVFLSTLPAGVINGECTLEGDQLKQQLSLGHSAWVAPGDGFHLFVGLASTKDNGTAGSYYWYLNWYDAAAKNEPFWTATATKEEMYVFAMEKSMSLESRFRAIVEATKVDGIRAPPIVFRDLQLDSLPEGRITLLGDAAHAMAPFRGEGGCHAIQDALNLGRALSSSSKEDVTAALPKFQKEMLQRGNEAVQRSRAVLGIGNGTNTDTAWGQKFQFVEA